MDSRNLECLVGDVASLFRSRFNQRASALGLTELQWQALNTLSCHEGINQRRLAALLEVEPMTLVRVLDRMEHERWVQRRADPEDRRARCLFLGEKAEAMFSAVAWIVQETRTEALAGFDDHAREWLKTMLEDIRSNLSGHAQAFTGFDDGTSERLKAMLEGMRANLSAIATSDEAQRRRQLRSINSVQLAVLYSAHRLAGKREAGLWEVLPEHASGNGTEPEVYQRSRRRTMKWTSAVLVVGTLGAGVTLLSTVPAGAQEAGYSTYATGSHGTNCNCTRGEDAATAAPQAPAKSARQASSAEIQSNIEGTTKLRR